MVVPKIGDEGRFGMNFFHKLTHMLTLSEMRCQLMAKCLNIVTKETISPLASGVWFNIRQL